MNCSGVANVFREFALQILMYMYVLLILWDLKAVCADFSELENS
jgi:hypothetical protein